MEFSFSPKRLVVAVAAALPLMASAADTPSTATARKGFAGYDHPNQYPAYRTLQFIEFARSCRPDKAFTPHPAINRRRPPISTYSPPANAHA